VSTSVGLARSLIKDLRNADASRKLERESTETAVLEADGAELARLLELNRGRLAMQLMLNRGETKENAESFVDTGLALIRFLGRGKLTVQDEPANTWFRLNFKLAK